MKEKFYSVSLNDLSLRLPEIGGSLVVLQRNAGADSGGRARSFAKETISELLKSLGESDRTSVDFLVVGSDPRIGVENEAHPESLVSLQTAQEVLDGVREAFHSFNLDDKQLLNNTAVPGGKIVEISEIKGWLPVKDSPELMEFLVGKAQQTGEDVAMLYETDAYKEERERLGVEGAKDIAARVENFLSFSRGSTNYHAKHNNRRLIFWAVTHFDTITPYLRNILAHPAECSDIISVDHLGGVVINIKNDHTATVTVQKREYETYLRFPLVTG
ncbi:MAG: hypothetical protein WC797_02740 [Candidatus Paceibacterota bacterium]|jgi:hypothetical protein